MKDSHCRVLPWKHVNIKYLSLVIVLVVYAMVINKV